MGRGKLQNAAAVVTRRSSRRRQVPEVEPGSPPWGQYAGQVRCTTAKGIDLDVDFYRNARDGMKAAWTCEVLEAHTADGEPAGYLKMAYVPANKLAHHYPSAWVWAIRDLGHWLPVKDLLDRPDSEWTREELQKALRYSGGYGDDERGRESWSDAQLHELWVERRRAFDADYARGYAEFKRFHVDRPVVDYISVYDERDFEVLAGVDETGRPQRVGRKGRRDLCRQGIATSLYELGALWMHQRGMQLHASSLQQPEPAAAWAKMADRGLVKPAPGAKKTRRVFDVEALLAQEPGRAGQLDGLSGP